MTSAKRALCVGINAFRNYPASALRGCVNDAHSMKGLLTGQFGFPANGVATMINTAATKTNIIEKLNELVTRAEEGHLTHLVFSLSTHGTLVPDPTPHGKAHMDDAFCPHDLAETDAQWDLNYIITGDELHDLFCRVPAEVIVECFFDTCHSGSALESLDTVASRKHRWLSAPHPKGMEALDGRARRGFGKRLREKKILHPVVWAACRKNQTSADSRIDNKWHGAFTHALLRQAKTARHQARSELLKHIQQQIKAERYTQIPELDATRALRNKPILSR